LKSKARSLVDAADVLHQGRRQRKMSGGEQNEKIETCNYNFRSL